MARLVDEAAEWRNFQDDSTPDKSRCERVNSLLDLSTARGGRQLSYRDNAVLAAQREINEVRGALGDGIPPHVVQLASELYADLMDSRAGGLQGLTIEGVRVAALHESLRLNDMRDGPSATLLCQQTGCSTQRFNSARKVLKASQTPLMQRLRMQHDRNIQAKSVQQANQVAAIDTTILAPLNARQRVKRKLEQQWGGRHVHKKGAGITLATAAQPQVASVEILTLQPALASDPDSLLQEINLDDIPEF